MGMAGPEEDSIGKGDRIAIIPMFGIDTCWSAGQGNCDFAL